MLVHTTDGGTTWVPEAIPVTTYLGEVTFFSATKGWAVGNGGVVLKSTDGGATWTQVTISTTKALQSIWFSDDSNGWIVGESGTIFHTSDGGATWNTQTSGTGNRLIRVRFLDAQTGWATGWGGTILYTSNGGTTWATQASGVNFDIISISIVDANNVWLASVVPVKNNFSPLFDNGKILSTANAGSTWQVQYTSAELLNAVSFVNLNEGWCFGSTGTIAHTTDGGITWLPQNSGVTEQFTVGMFTDANHGWAAGENGVIVNTNDGGTTGINDPGKESTVLRLTNEPNPFTGITRITYYIPAASKVKICITDVSGKNVAALVNQQTEAGNHSLTWDASSFPQGTYFCILQAGDKTVTGKLIVR